MWTCITGWLNGNGCDGLWVISRDDLTLTHTPQPAPANAAAGQRKAALVGAPVAAPAPLAFAGAAVPLEFDGRATFMHFSFRMKHFNASGRS